MTAVPRAPGLVTAEIELAVACLLGAAQEVATAAVAALVAVDGLGHGIALPALVAASRSGSDAVAALAGFADGAEVPLTWSDYELRQAAEEARGDVTDRLRALVALPADDVLHLPARDAPLTAVQALPRVSRLVTGPLAIGPDWDAAAATAAQWIGRLCAAAGRDHDVAQAPPAERPGPPSAPRSEAFVDVLG